MGKYLCCFCGKKIEGNIVALLAVTNWQDEDEEMQQSQQLFCHLECLGRSLHSEDFLYIDEE